MSFYHTRNHTQPGISQVAFSPSCQNSIHVLIREKLGTQDHRNFGLTGSVWFFCDLW
jgi:hypothetical protein